MSKRALSASGAAADNTLGVHPTAAEMSQALSELAHASEAIAQAERDMEQARLDLAAALRTLHAGGMTFEALGKLLDVSRQRAAQLAQRGI